MTLDPQAVRVALILLMVLVAGFDIGIAFIMRTQKEAGSDVND